MPGGACHRLVSHQELAEHQRGVRDTFSIGDPGEAGEIAVGAGCGLPQRADALGDEVDGKRELVVLRLEHHVQRLEHRAGDVPVEVGRLEVHGVRLGEKAREALGDLQPLFRGDADVDLGNRGSHGSHLRNNKNTPYRLAS